MDGERGRPGAPGLPVSAKTCDFQAYKHQGQSPGLSLHAFINTIVNFRDILDLKDSKDPKGPKEIK